MRRRHRRTQVDVRSAPGVTPRTLRNWSEKPGFVRALAHARTATAPAAAIGAPQPLPKRRPRQPAGAASAGGVPLFPATAAGRAERLAYYEARKLSICRIRSSTTTT